MSGVVYLVEAGDYEQRGVYHVIATPEDVVEVLRRSYAPYEDTQGAPEFGPLTADGDDWWIETRLPNGIVSRYDITLWSVESGTSDL